MSEYLERLQNEEVEILKSIHKACDSLGIKYVIMYGTLLGAVRHKGFIPWDDDIDIVMTRDDFDLFLQKGQSYLPEYLFVQHYSTEPEDNKIYIKVRNKNTIFLENDNSEDNICHGIFVDIFPLDKCKIKAVKKERLRRSIWETLVQCYSINTIKTIQNSFKRFLARFVHNTYCKLVKLSTVLAREEKRRKKINANGDDCFLLSTVNANTVTYEELFTRKLFPFGKNEFWGPASYDSILRKSYGDYMIIPPPEKQITHKPKLVKFSSDVVKNESNGEV